MLSRSILNPLACSPRRSVARLLTAAVLLAPLGVRAATINVNADSSQVWNGYLTVYTNGLNHPTPPAYLSQWLGAGTSFPNQSSIDDAGHVACAPDIWCDQNYPADTWIWADASGTSTGICDVVSDFYVDSATIANPGDTVVFTGMLLTNTLAAPYKTNATVFIKDFAPDYTWRGGATVNLSTLTNGQAFGVTYGPIAGAGDHVQWGVEWSGPPARQTTVASLGSVILSTNETMPPAEKTVNVSLDHHQYWAAYQTASVGTPFSAGYLGAAGAPDLQGTISDSDVVQCAPDLRMDKLYHTDTTIWSDATGLSDANPGVTVDSTYYVDTGTLAATGDTVVFSGRLLTNTLVEPYASSIVAFIKDFDTGFGWHGMVTVNLNTLTNGEDFSISKVISGDGSHVQYGFEWVGPPARTNAAAASYVGNLGQVLVTNQLVTTAVGIVAINPNPAQVKVGADVTLTAITTGAGLTYQWSKDGVQLTNGPGVAGATTNPLVLSGVQGAAQGTYTLVVTNSGGQSATKDAQLFVYNPGWLYFDRADAPFNGYINVWNGTNLISSPPPSGSAGTRPKASFGFGVTPPTLLRASMDLSNDVITLQPNTYVYDNATNAMDPTYINSDGSPAAYLEQDYFIQNNALVGDTLVFAGYCSSNSLDPKYTATAWIKVSKDWSVECRYDTNLEAGRPFVLTVPATATANQAFVQYGFAIWGPCNSATNPITQGVCEVRVYSPIALNRSANGVDLSFPTVVNHHYTVQYTTNLVSHSWNDLGTLAGTATTNTISDPLSDNTRFYRLLTW
ncbi:MAG: immunoglobulin domain-containing protein [Verrucomicrobia bacterium]|nr:immunoglobulin domain-containing protein [Verrucomicrobiota bacterium]